MGAFDHLNGPQCGAFERHFRPGRGNLNNNFQKSQMPGGLPGGGMLNLRFDRYVTRASGHEFRDETKLMAKETL